jgi:hypothetical protein
LIWLSELDELPMPVVALASTLNSPLNALVLGRGFAMRLGSVVVVSAGATLADYWAVWSG